MLIGVIADDFTGGSDVANTLAKGVGSVCALNYFKEVLSVNIYLWLVSRMTL